MITSSNTMALNNHYATALGPRLGLGLRLDFGSVSCELGLIETNPPTGSTQNRRVLGGPTNGRANACRRRLAAVEMANPPIY